MFFPYYELAKIYRRERLKEAEYYQLLQDLSANEPALQDSSQLYFHLDNDTTNGDIVAFNQLLTERWLEPGQPPIRILAYYQRGPSGEAVCTYAQYITQLLMGQLSYFQAGVAAEADLAKLAKEIDRKYDLFILGEPDQAPFKRFISAPVGCKMVKQIPTSVLVVRRPRQSLQRILFVTREQRLDEVAIDWLVPLAQASNAAVTVLLALPQAPPMYCRDLRQTDLTYWLTTDTPLGRQLRRISRCLINWDIRLKLQFRPGLPREQIEHQVEEDNPDLIILAADSSNWWQRRIPGVLVEPLLQWIDRPVLVAKPVEVYARN